MYLVVGLGNPGREYEKTRHNLGFMVVDQLASSCPVFFKKHRSVSADTADARIRGHRVIFCKPMTFMNKSGEPVAPLAAYFRVPVNRVIVVHDDLDLDFGRVKLAFNRGAGGHNGIRSLIRYLGTEFVRVRVGVGRPPVRVEPHAFVLGRLCPEEADLLPACLDHAAMAVEMIVDKGITEAMNHFNRRG